MYKDSKSLSPVYNPLNSFFIEKKYMNVEQKFKQLIELVEGMPRTTSIKKSQNHWKGVCRSKIFKFPDDVEIFMKKSFSRNNTTEGIIQIKSKARLGYSDFGVNQRRVFFLINELNKIISEKNI